MEVLHKQCVEVVDIKRLPTGDFDMSVLDLEDHKDYRYVITPGRGIWAFAPGYFFYIEFYKDGPRIHCETRRAFRDAETCLRKSHHLACHGSAFCDELSSTPKNTINYFVLDSNAVKTKTHKRDRSGSW